MSVPITGKAFRLTLIRLPDGTVHYETTDGLCDHCGALRLRQNVNGCLSDDKSFRHCTNRSCTWDARDPTWQPGMTLGDDHVALIADALADVQRSRAKETQP